jgi:UTP--glucose-1-phosphate uridylyltransferase
VHFYFENSTGQTQFSLTQMPGADISKYVVIIRGDTPGAVAAIVEKPRFDEAPSDTVSIGRYILMQYIFDVLQDLLAGSGGEIQLADAINIQAQRCNLKAVHSTLFRFDCGSVGGFFLAIAHVSNLRIAKMTDKVLSAT